MQWYNHTLIFFSFYSLLRATRTCIGLSKIYILSVFMFYKFAESFNYHSSYVARFAFKYHSLPLSYYISGYTKITAKISCVEYKSSWLRVMRCDHFSASAARLTELGADWSLREIGTGESEAIAATAKRSGAKDTERNSDETDHIQRYNQSVKYKWLSSCKSCACFGQTKAKHKPYQTTIYILIRCLLLEQFFERSWFFRCDCGGSKIWLSKTFFITQ